MSKIPTRCFVCGDLLTYKPSCPNRVEDNHIIKWVCRECFIESKQKRTKTIICAKEKKEFPRDEDWEEGITN